MKHFIDIQQAQCQPIPVSEQQIEQWAVAALFQVTQAVEICIRIVDKEEIHNLNLQYRQMDKPTNVLSFPAELDFIPVEQKPLGDVVLCAAILEEEASLWNVPLEHHWAHIIVHGILHLQGYDHIEDHEAAIMQELEANILLEMGYENPYKTAAYAHEH